MITRENYEEFFILYVDNELPAAARSAVDKFIADNPDLREELTALLQCRVSPDQEPEFRDKDILFNYESPLLSYVDGELGEPERSSVEELVRRNPRAAAELRHLQMTVSQPDPSIVFPDKESLYRNQRRRAVILPWLRAGIAAAVLGAAALLLLARNDSTGIAGSGPNKILPVVTSVGPDTLNLTKKRDDVVGRQATVLAKTSDKRRKGEQVAVMVAKNEGTQKKDTKEASIDVTPAVKTDVVATDQQLPKEQATSAIGEQSSLSTAVAVVNIPKEKSSFATQALLQQDQDQENSIAEVSAPPAKNKLRGLFRKVGRAFGKTADSDSDGQREVLISAFQVALK